MDLGTAELMHLLWLRTWYFVKLHYTGALNWKKKDIVTIQGSNESLFGS